jgi:hypothetical protein
MIWLFERGNEIVRLTTRFLRASGEYTILVEWSDGRAETERFSDFAAFDARILALERQLGADHWTQAGRPQLIQDDWRGPTN